MLGECLKITAFVQDRGACTGYRVGQPVNRIKTLGLAEVHVSGSGDRRIAEELDRSDVVFLSRAASDTSYKFVSELQRLGKKIVYDLDDNMFDISPMSPHYRELGVSPMEMSNPTGVAPLSMWTHGVDGFDVINNRIVRRDFINMVRKVDCVTVTTEPLANVYRRYNDNVYVIPNSVDFGVWHKPPDIEWNGTKVRLVYTGAANHLEDWMFVLPVLEDLQCRYPNLTIISVGMDWKFMQSKLDSSRVEAHGWVDFDAYPWMMKTLCADIAIAPIEMTTFNDCRSSIKWVEHSSMKTPVVATDFGPYKRDMEHGKTGMLVKTRDDWNKALSVLIENRNYRNELGENAYNHCKLNFNLDFMVDKWMNVFNAVLK